MKADKVSSLLLGLILIFTLFSTGLCSGVTFDDGLQPRIEDLEKTVIVRKKTERGMAIGYLYELSKRYCQNGRYQEALNCIKKILLIDPNDEEAQRWIYHIERAIASKASGRLKAREATPELKAKETVGKEEQERKAKQRAETEYIRKAKMAKPEEKLRIVEQAKGKELEAKRKLNKERAKYHYNLALSYDQSRRYEEAVAEYEKVLEIVPDDPDTHYNLAIIYDDYLEDKEKAIEHYQKYLELCPTAEDTKDVAEWIRRAIKEMEWGR